MMRDTLRGILEQLTDRPPTIFVANDPHTAEGGDPAHEGGLMSAEVLTIEYVHVDDPEGIARFHDFENEDEPTYMYALEDGSAVVIFKRDGSPIVAAFDEE